MNKDYTCCSSSLIFQNSVLLPNIRAQDSNLTIPHMEPRNKLPSAMLLLAKNLIQNICELHVSA